MVIGFTPLPLDFPLYASLHITYKEAFAIYLAAKHWGLAWANHHIIIHRDNQVAVAMINKGCTRNPLAMSFLRDFFWLSATFNFRITAKYIPGVNNHIPDAISRLHEADKLLFFFRFLVGQSPCADPGIVPLANHKLADSALFLSYRYCCT